METLLNDIRYTMRTLRNNPGFAAIAVLSLALGIGANTAIFSIYSSFFLSPPPLAEPERLVEVYTNDRADSDDFYYSVSSYPDYLDMVERTTDIFEGLTIYSLSLTILQGEVESDCAPLNFLVQAMLKACPEVHSLRDPTRGGLATVLWEIAQASGVGVVVEEGEVPIRKEVKGVCDLLGFDPYYLANEGRLVAFVPEGEVKAVLKAMQKHPLGKEATVIGKVTAENSGKVLLHTPIGGHRLLEPLSGEQFPRIC